ncbi:DUF1491 family protein [Hyphobacterium sp. HN65]|uniref:DUF1491 family protein n=1 Tax=Hyphobacterium lacteum TaxID=3116575 RepID=A0ABU7LSZ7_9PROT|nr:DUF1491 family protein [Hyphobacterium sp. HN65]MEE2527045.1 DUF1491 family protein [Hyphobacterium sp. HN65]
MNRLKSEIWVQALLRRAEVAGVMGGVVRKGDTDAGAVLVQVMLLDGTGYLYVPARDFEGDRIWIRPLGTEPVSEADIAQYTGKRLDDDPDIWVVEIEDPKGRHFLTEPVE